MLLRRAPHSSLRNGLEASRVTLAALLLSALHAGCVEFIALLPSDGMRKVCGLPSQRKSEARHGGIAGEIHRRMVLITGLVIMLCGVFLVLLESPCFVMSLEFHALINRERRNSNSCQTEMVGAVVMSGFRTCVWSDC